MNIMTFGGINSRDYDAFVSIYETFDAPERVIEAVEVPGRSGDLIIDKGTFRNVEQKYSLIFTDAEKMKAYCNAVYSQTGYRRLEDSRHPEEYRLAHISGKASPKASGYRASAGAVDLTFTCKPQRFLKIGEQAVTITKTDEKAFENPTRYTALPLIRVYGSGTLTIGNGTLTVSEHEREYIDIDSDIGDCYFGAENMNGYVSVTRHEFPTLPAGTTGVTLDGITKVEITPRWWRL